MIEFITGSILAENPMVQWWCEENNTFLLWNGTFAVPAWGSLVQGKAEGRKDSARGPEVQQHWDAGAELCQPQLLQQPWVVLLISWVAQSHFFLPCDFSKVVWEWGHLSVCVV